MAISYPAVLEAVLPGVQIRYTETDTMLHALSLGFGSNPLDPAGLCFAAGPRLRAFPTLALALGYVPMREMPLGIDYERMVLGGVRLVSHAHLSTAGEVSASHRVTDVTDLGPGRGALVGYERKLRDSQSGRLLATAFFTAFCRGDGGFGGPSARPPLPAAAPDRAPDFTCELPTFLQQALLYRLAGDHAPIHADPEVAAKAGFERPLLQGLVVFGMVARALVNVLAGGDERRLAELQGRFSSPLYPGETLVIHMWKLDAMTISVSAHCKQRRLVVFERGQALLHPAAADMQR